MINSIEYSDKNYSEKTVGKKYAVAVSLDNGFVYEFDVENLIESREHVKDIIKMGYKRNNGFDLEWYPPHRITKVEVIGGHNPDFRDRIR